MIEYEEDGDTSLNTDWQKHPSFPFFMQNVVVALGSGSRFNAMKAILLDNRSRSNPCFRLPRLMSSTQRAKRIVDGERRYQFPV